MRKIEVALISLDNSGNINNTGIIVISEMFCVDELFESREDAIQKVKELLDKETTCSMAVEYVSQNKIPFIRHGGKIYRVMNIGNFDADIALALTQTRKERFHRPLG